jgi:hypothetical protein
VQRAQVDCDLESGKKLGVDVVDDCIPVDNVWQQAGEEGIANPISLHGIYRPRNAPDLAATLSFV